MSPRESNVRISIVVPHLGDDVAFEESLVSVLENRPANSEVCVVHDGTYADPFELADEVRFVTADSSDLPKLMAMGAAAAAGQVVHFIGNGVRATYDWTATAVERFASDDVAIVAPLAISEASGKVAAAGWCDSRRDVSAPVASGFAGSRPDSAGQTRLGRRQLASVRGGYLTASFWRREALLDAVRGFPTDDWVAAEFAWSRLLTAAGWRCEIADESLVLGELTSLTPPSGFRRGCTLRGLSNRIDQRSALTGLMGTVLAGLSPLRLFSGGGCSEALGQLASLVCPGAAVRGSLSDQIGGPQSYEPEDQRRTIPLTTDSSYPRAYASPSHRRAA